MKNDLYTKIVLTVIAVSMAVIALKPIIRPEAASAQAPFFSGVQLVTVGSTFWFFDSRTGDLWQYPFGGFDTESAFGPDHYRINKLGQKGEFIPKAR